MFGGREGGRKDHERAIIPLTASPSDADGGVVALELQHPFSGMWGLFGSLSPHVLFAYALVGWCRAVAVARGLWARLLLHRWHRRVRAQHRSQEARTQAVHAIIR